MTTTAYSQAARRAFKECLPPLLLRFWRNWRLSKMPREWEYVGRVWPVRGAARGWDRESVGDAYLQQWHEMKNQVESGRFFHSDLVCHNTMLAFAYSLALAARQKDKLSMLDYGGNLGRYNLFARAFVPDLKIEYSCKDMPHLVALGRALQPDARFYDDESCFNSMYDFVLVSCSLQYNQEWLGELEKCADSASDYLFLTRLPIVQGAPYVYLQRAYGTEYVSWCFNRDELLSFVTSRGFEMMREFDLSEVPRLPHGAPEAFTEQGFLFKRR